MSALENGKTTMHSMQEYKQRYLYIFKMADKTGSSNRSSCRAHNRSSWPNESKVCITVINSSVKKNKKFSTTTYSNKLSKVSTNKCDNDGQPEIAVWPSKREVLISATVWQYDRHHCNSDCKPSIRASSQKVSTGYHQQQPETATWLPKPEIVISLVLQLIASKLQRQLWPWWVRIKCP